MKNCVVLTGAGISADSGLKTFRDAGGLWEGSRIEDVATPQAFNHNPQLVIEFYNQRRQQLQSAQPNAAHLALVELEQKYQVNIITQNVDNLHEKAGSKHILHLHGELTKLRSSHDAGYVIDFFDQQTLATKDPNGFLMRPHIVWFGEMVPNLEPAIALTAAADIIIIIGTSMQVYPAASLIDYARTDAKIYLVDPAPVKIDGINIISASAKDGVPKLVAELINAA